MGLTRVRSKFLSSPHVVALSLRENNIHEIAHDAFEKLLNLCYLDLSRNPLINNLFHFELPSKTKVLVLDSIAQENNGYGYQRYNNYEHPLKFSRTYYNVEYLYLRNNQLSDTDPQWQMLFPNVKYLFLSNNHLGQGFLFNIPESVTHLYLEYNMIREFHIRNIGNLVSLSLDGNNLESTNHFYDVVNLEGAVNLEILSIGHNRISRIHPAAFSYAQNLRSLNLSHNEISNLHSEVFTDIPNLQKLLLNHNELITIPDLCVLENLEILSLEYNNIISVSANSFCNTTALKYLNLTGNQILNLEPHAFQNINMLEVLDLSDNNLHYLPVDWNLPLKGLTNLYLKDNYFKDLDLIFLNNFAALQNLYLQNNSITMLNTDSFRNVTNLNLYLI